MNNPNLDLRESAWIRDDLNLRFQRLPVQSSCKSFVLATRFLVTHISPPFERELENERIGIDEVGYLHNPLKQDKFEERLE